MSIKKDTIIFTQRDLKIFKFLSYYGYADLEALYMLTKNFYPCSMEVFLKRIYRLRKTGWLEINNYSMPSSTREVSRFKFFIISGNVKTFMHLKMRPPEIKLFKSNFFHEFFIIRTLAKCMENGEAVFSERMDEYSFSQDDIRPDVYMPDKKIGFEIETSVKRNWTEYAYKFAVLQRQLDAAKWAKKEPDIKKLIYLVESSDEKMALIKKIENTKSQSIDLGKDGKEYIVDSTINEHIRVFVFDNFFKQDISSFH